MRPNTAKQFFVATVCLLAPASAFAAEGGAEGEAPHQPLVAPTVWAIIVFLAVLFVLWKKLFPQIIEGLDKRAKAIQGSLDAAKAAKEEAEAMMAKHESNLETARQEARAIIDEGKADAERVKEQIVEDARKESSEILERAKREIELAKGSALDDLHKKSVGLSLDLTTKLIQKTLTAEDNQQLIKETIDSFRANG